MTSSNEPNNTSKEDRTPREVPCVSEDPQAIRVVGCIVQHNLAFRLILKDEFSRRLQKNQAG